YSGGSVTKGANGTTSMGTDLSLRLSGATNVSLNGFVARINAASASALHAQLDILASYTLKNGNSISLRGKLLGGGARAAVDQSVAYLEYGMPLHVPVSRLRTPGRVYGKVVDAISGKGVANALVRLGPQAAITDKDGNVAFGGVPGGEHRVSMSQEASLADAVFVGDAKLRVD